MWLIEDELLLNTNIFIDDILYIQEVLLKNANVRKC